VRRVVVVGASVAGVNAAQALREAGFQGEVVLVGEEPHQPYDRPPLSKEALHGELDLGRLGLRGPDWYDQHGVELRLGAAAAGLDVGGRRVLLADGADLPYDGLVLATGAAPRRLPGTGAVPGVHVLRRVEDCLALRRAMLSGRRIVVVGAGFIGLEVAATAVELGLDVTVVEVAPVPLARALGDEVGAWFARLHRDHGVHLRVGVDVRGVDGVDGADGRAGRYRVRLGDGGALAADVVVAGIGVVPAVGWLRGSGVDVGDGVLCDAYCRTSAPGVVAAGDVARWYNALFDEQMRVEHWTNAVEQGRAAALALLGQADSAYAPVPYFWSDQYDARVRFVGRSFAAQAVHVEEPAPGSLVALYGRDGLVRGALCVNAPRAAATYRRHILDQVPWQEAVPS
jgi:NADPH-dependent 2,4-dienoyl-CoA reductase/sulfur reductase-like enzyme